MVSSYRSANPCEKGGKATGPSPVDRGKAGSKHHLICGGKGTPFKVITTATNVNDVTQTRALVDGIPPVAGKPGRPRRRPATVLGDKGYDSNPISPGTTQAPYPARHLPQGSP
ncbi:transposase [Streptomyces abikoensis]|uniref:transposase n=1 Tax=Streptomyces abikoensis TaxID=97398 RepID=UPI001672526E|nr:transposase [Streptomyces abikoensis]